MLSLVALRREGLGGVRGPERPQTLRLCRAVEVHSPKVAAPTLAE